MAGVDRLAFWSGSKPAPPGQGAHEHVSDPQAYAALAAIANWRQVLSNFDASAGEFEWAGHRWRTIEHAFQAAKIFLASTEEAMRFTVDSGDELGAGSGLDARRARKVVVLDAARLAAWDARKDAVMLDIARAKYAACPAAREVLLATGAAELWHLAPRSRPVRFEHLERIRGELRAR